MCLCAIDVHRACTDTFPYETLFPLKRDPVRLCMRRWGPKCSAAHLTHSKIYVYGTAKCKRIENFRHSFDPLGYYVCILITTMYLYLKWLQTNHVFCSLPLPSCISTDFCKLLPPCLLLSRHGCCLSKPTTLSSSWETRQYRHSKPLQEFRCHSAGRELEEKNILCAGLNTPAR